MLSLLDVLSYGLGASVFLCIIFSATGQPATKRRALTPGAIAATIQARDSDALLQLIVWPPGKHGAQSAAVEVAPAALVEGEGKVIGGFRVTAYGFSPGGSASLKDPAGPTGRRYLVYLSDLEEGGWRLGVRYFNRTSRLHGWNKSGALRNPVDVSIEAHVASEKKPPPSCARETCVSGTSSHSRRC